jgi:hypothetical protein
MRELDEDELDELVESQRHLTIAGFTVVGLIVLGIVVFVAVAPDGASGGPIRLSGGIGILIGFLLTLPQRSLIKQLGLTRVEAIQILAAERERRSPRPVLSEDLIRRKRALWYVVAAVGLLAGVVALVYAFAVGGRVQPEGTPTDPLFATAIIAVPVGLIGGVLALLTGQGYGIALRARSAAQ